VTKWNNLLPNSYLRADRGCTSANAHAWKTQQKAKRKYLMIARPLVKPKLCSVVSLRANSLTIYNIIVNTLSATIWLHLQTSATSNKAHPSNQWGFSQVDTHCDIKPNPVIYASPHLWNGISSLLHSVNLILFTLLLVHLILCASPDHHLLLPLPFTPDLKLISFTNPFLHSHSYSFQTAFRDLNL